MCSINEEDLDTLPQVDTDSESLSDICKKCSSMAAVVLRKRDVYCVSCFSAAVNHKFRASLGKNKTFRANQRVLLAISGGLASSVLLNFVHNGICEDAHKKLRVDALCIYINDQMNGDSETHWKNCVFMLGQCKRYGLPLYICHMCNVLDEHISVSEPDTVPPVDAALLEKFNALINSVSSETSRRDFIMKLRRNLLIRCAAQLKCDYIFTGEISTCLASTMLSNLTLGRGAQIEDDIGFCDSRDTIKILKPIKDLSHEEMKIYADINKIPHLNKSTAIHNDSIQSTIEKFVVDLQENYPATISTICKTGEKMGGCSKIISATSDRCVVCQSVLDTQEMKSSALQATDFSRVVSSTGPHHRAPDTTTSTASCSGCNCSKQQIPREDIEKFLCYGCKLIFRDVKDENMSPYFQNIVKATMAMAKLRQEINDFLI